MPDIRTTARQIITSNIYCTLATCTKTGRPWASPVFYCLDNEYNLYFISKNTSRHIRYIKRNPRVAFAIFDSHQPEGTGNGIQGYGTVKEIGIKRLKTALRWYRSTFIPLNPKTLSGRATYRLFKLIPTQLYILNPQANSDKRIKVFLK